MTAVEIAIEALKQFADPNNWSLKPGCLQWTGKRNAIEYAESIVAALTAEPSPVPPDRERLRLAEVLDAVARIVIDGGPASDDIRSAAALLRQPAPAEVEAMIARLLGSTCPSELRQDAAALLRRLALPAVGDWHDIASAPKDGTDVLLWVCTRGSIRRGWTEICWWGTHSDHGKTWMRNNGKDIVGPGVATHWQPLPAPPIPEEPKP